MKLAFWLVAPKLKVDLKNVSVKEVCHHQWTLAEHVYQTGNPEPVGDLVGCLKCPQTKIVRTASNSGEVCKRSRY